MWRKYANRGRIDDQRRGVVAALAWECATAHSHAIAATSYIGCSGQCWAATRPNTAPNNGQSALFRAQCSHTYSITKPNARIVKFGMTHEEDFGGGRVPTPRGYPASPPHPHRAG